MGRLIDADKLKADLEKAISKNEDMDCLDFLRVVSVIDAQPTAYDPDKVVEQLQAEFKKYLIRTIEIVKTGQITGQIDENKALDEKHTAILDTEDMER